MALGLGGNLGDPARTLAQACHVLHQRLGLRDVRRSSLYRSPLWLPPETVAGLSIKGLAVKGPAAARQPLYYNAVLVGHCRLEPNAVLAVTQAVELAAGRRRRERNAPRPLDVDLLLYGELRLERPELTLPHPRLHQRRFAWEPLAEIWPGGRAALEVMLGVELGVTLGVESTPQVLQDHRADGLERVDWPQ